MRLLRSLSNIPSKLVVITLVTMIIIHLIILAVYTSQHSYTQRYAERNKAIQQVMNIIHMVQATPKHELAQAVTTLTIPHFQVNLSNTPTSDNRIISLSYWRISQAIPGDAQDFNLSLHLSDERWLNIVASIPSKRLWSQLLLLALEISIVFIVIFYAWSINRFTKPLKEFQKAAERLGVEVTHTPLEEYRGPQVVRETATAMNKMQKRIKDLIHDRTVMLAAISHDLRTPLTRLKLRLSQLKDEKLAQKSNHDLDEMESMIREILAFANQTKDEEHKVKLDLNSFLQSLCDDLTDVGYKVTYNTNVKRAPFKGRALALKRAFNNLIQNAVKYGQEAHVNLTYKSHRFTITIDDKGPGIPENELDQVFAPFYRCDRSRSRTIAGTGLGLAVAHEVILAHRGEIKLQNRPEGGLRVLIIL